MMAFFRVVGTLVPQARRVSVEVASHGKVDLSARMRMGAGGCWGSSETLHVVSAACLAAGVTYVLCNGGGRWVRVRADALWEMLRELEVWEGVRGVLWGIGERWAELKERFLSRYRVPVPRSYQSYQSYQSPVKYTAPVKTRKEVRRVRDSTMFTYLGKGKNRMTVELCVNCVETNRLLRQLATDAGLEYDKYEPCSMCRDRLERLECVQTGSTSPSSA